MLKLRGVLRNSPFFICKEVLLWEYRKELVKYICINNYSIAHARRILTGREHDKD